MQPIVVVPIKPSPPDCIEIIRDKLVETFGVPVSIAPNARLDPSPAYDPSRNQYYSSIILASLLQQYPDHSGKILAITAGDLFVPILTYVFGEAQLDGSAAVISSYRLDERFYGFPANIHLFEERLFKEAVHELGHTFGLVHCQRFDCVMHSSTAVEDIDIRLATFCGDCRTVLEGRTRA